MLPAISLVSKQADLDVVADAEFEAVPPADHHVGGFVDVRRSPGGRWRMGKMPSAPVSSRVTKDAEAA